MSTDRDLNRIVRSWLREDGREDADRVLDLVLDHLDTTPQRHVGWRARRFPIMNTTTLRLGVAAVAVIVAVVLGFTLLPENGIGDAAESPTPSQSAPAQATSAAPSIAQRNILAGDPVPEEMLNVDYVSGETVFRIYPGGHAECSRIPVDGFCFRADNAGNVVQGPAAMIDGLLAVKNILCASCAPPEMNSTLYFELREGGALLYGLRCDGSCQNVGDAFRREE